MRPACRFEHAPTIVKFGVSRIAVRLYDARKIVQVPLRMLAFAIGSVSKPYRRRNRSGAGTLIAHVGPESAGFGFSVSGCEYRNRRIVGMNDIGGKDVPSKRIGK